MLPLRDHTPTSSVPFINYGIIAINIFVFLLELGSENIEVFIQTFGFTPGQFFILDPLSYIPLFTSMWVHAGIFHILSNMWFLHIFGDNIEDRLGHIKYLLFYLLCGLGATGLQYIISSESRIPMVGASGAISGVAGAYVILFSRSKIETLVPLGYYVTTAMLPSWLFLGYWFMIQLFSGVGSIATGAVEHGGVAWFAHIGGFLTGIALLAFFRTKKIQSVWQNKELSQSTS